MTMSSNYSGTNLESRVLTALQEVDSSITFIGGADLEAIHTTYNYDAWDKACSYAEAEDSSKVSIGSLNVSKTAFDPLSDADLGLDHFKPKIRSSILAGNSVIPYYGFIPKQGTDTGFETRSRITVFVNDKAYSFDKDYPSYFRAIRDGIHHYLASEIFLADNETIKAASANTNGDDYYDNNKLTA